MSLSPSQRLASIDDLLLYRLGRLSSTAGALVVRLCEGGYGITRREWAVVAQLYENGGLPPSVLAERMQARRGACGEGPHLRVGVLGSARRLHEDAIGLRRGPALEQRAQHADVGGGDPGVR